MKPEDEVLADLNALAESDRGLEAPARVEANVRAAFRARRSRRRRGLWPPRAWKMIPRAWKVVPMAAAAAILVVILSYGLHRVRVAPGIAGTRVAVPGLSDIAPAVHPVSPEVRAPGVEAAPIARRVARRNEAAAPREIATDFFPLVDFAPPVDGAELFRVSLPASAMRDVGLPVREDRLEDRVQADVLVSEGRATAIRFVKYLQ
jgi:hypothetical protein